MEKLKCNASIPILVVGYYNHYNLGDEQYKISIKHLLKKVLYDVSFDLQFIDCDKLDSFAILPNSVVILGGGDVLNTYFLNKLNTKITPDIKIKDNLTVIALSVGIPYNDIFMNPDNKTKLDIFDTIFLRTRQDISLFSSHFDKGQNATELLTSKGALHPEKFEDNNPMNKSRIRYLPDTSCYVSDALHISSLKNFIITNDVRFITCYNRIKTLKQKIIGISFCRHIYHPDKPYYDNYHKIIQNFALLIYNLVKDGYFVVLVPFNTKPLGEIETTENKENDTLIQSDIMDLLSDTVRPSVLNIDFTLALDEMLLLYSTFHVMIPMRFHATLFSVYTGVPMIPIYTTKKIHNFLLDINWNPDYGYILDKNEKDLPTKFDRKLFMIKFNLLVKPNNYAEAKYCLHSSYHNFLKVSKECYPAIRKIVLENSKDSGLRTRIEDADEYDFLLNTQLVNCPKSSASEACFGLSSSVCSAPCPPSFITNSTEFPVINTLVTKLHEFSQDHGYMNFREIQDPYLQDIIVCVVSYYLTNTIDSSYNHGLITKMFTPDYDYINEWSWVITHHNGINNITPSNNSLPNSSGDHRSPSELVLQRLQAPLPNSSGSSEATRYGSPLPKFNIDYIDQNDKSGAHRSGWKYVYDNIRKYSSHSSTDLLLDLYVDRTFHWKRKIYKYIDIIPYKKPWVGVIHHTFDTTFSDHNNHTLLSCPEFLESLRYCKGIIVLSKTLQLQFLEYLKGIEHLNKPLPVIVLTHPTEVAVSTFNYQEFLDNQDIKLLHVGGWLRNIFSFYQIELANEYIFHEIPESEIEPRLSGDEPYNLGSISDSPPLTKSRPWWQGGLKASFTTNSVGLCSNIVAGRVWQRLCCKKRPPDIPLLGVIETNTPKIKTRRVKIQKVALKGKYMNNYFPYLDTKNDVPFDKGVSDFFPMCSFSPFISSDNISVDSNTTSLERHFYVNCMDTRNNWYRHMNQYIQTICDNTKVLEYVDNHMYDSLLTKNIVFLNLVDGSAINTLLECVIRNTPIIVNRHPAVVEVLGNDYPFYYIIPEGCTQPFPSVHDLLNRPGAILEAHQYLTNIDKTPFMIETFTRDLMKILGEVSEIQTL
uniref:Polysaccharide pyruvyl transferase domain-containing protein n=1 Tax=viral metagenome TaxID=1070528 RepID=A0A6C0ICC1_9ZZZZ